MKLEDKLFQDRYIVDEEFAHLKIKDPSQCEKCVNKQCTVVCPSEVYTWEEDHIDVAYADCLECGTCRIACSEFDNLEWSYPRGGFGVQFKFG
jgi:ferredoxin like protein